MIKKPRPGGPAANGSLPAEYRSFLREEKYLALAEHRVSVPAMSIPPHFVRYCVDGKVLGTKASAASIRARLLGDLSDVLGEGREAQILLFAVTDFAGDGEPGLALVIDLEKVSGGKCPIDLYLDGVFQPVAPSIAEFVERLEAPSLAPRRAANARVSKLTIGRAEYKIGVDEISARECELESIPAEIGLCSKLVKLDLVDNKLKTLPPELADCPALETLFLDGNPIESLPIIPSLQSLHLSGIQITPALWTSICQMKQLASLALPGCDLGDVPPGIGGLVNLERLELRDGRIRSLPAELASCRKLTVVSMGKGTTEPSPPRPLPSLPIIPSLECLVLADVKVTPGVWRSIVEMKELDELTLTGCGLDDIAGIGNLPKLEGLYLNGNALTELPVEMAKLSLLTHLRLTDNPIQVLPDWLTSLKNLERIGVRRTKLSDAELTRVRALLPNTKIAE